MRTVSERFRAQLGGYCMWLTVVEWTNDGVTWAPARLQAGTVTRSLSDQVHWQASLSLSGVSDGLDGINPYNTRVRIRHGLQFAPGDFELLNFGRYRVTQTTMSRTGLQVELSSYEQFLVGAVQARPHTYKAASADAFLSKVIGEVIPEASIVWSPAMQDKRNTPIPDVLTEADRWSVVDGTDSSDSVAAAIAGRVITGPDGGFLVIPVPTLDDTPVGSVVAGPGGLLIDSSEEHTLDGVANVIVVTGTSTDSPVVIGPAIVKDTDPNSPTYYARPIAAGGFGQVPFFFNSSLITTEEQAVETARSKLASRVGLRQAVTFDSAHDPTKEPGDVLMVADGRRVILDSVTYDLAGGPLQAETRSQASRLDGAVSDAPTDDGGEGEDG